MYFFQLLRFGMNLGSEITANIIGDPRKAFWKNCLLSVEEEGKLAEAFRENFKQYDFTL